METFKVIKSFGTAKKGDLFVREHNDPIFHMERVDEHKDGKSKAYIAMEMTEDIVNELVKNGYMIEILDTVDSSAENSVDKIEELKNYIANLISTYEASHKEMLESFENGDVQPCVKVEAETVYFNLLKVLHAIQDKINE